MAEDNTKALREKTAANWRAYVELLDESIASISATLDRLRAESQRLHREAAAAILTEIAFDPPAAAETPVPAAEPPSAEEIERQRVELEQLVAQVREAADAPEAATEAEEPAAPQVAPAPDDVAAQRAELERIVAAARELPADEAPAKVLSGFEGLSEGGGFFDASLPPAKAPRRAAEPKAEDPEAAAREELRRAVMEARDEIAAGIADDTNDVADSEEKAEAEEPAAAIVGAEAPAAGLDEEARREELRRAVEASRAEITKEAKPSLAELMNAKPIDAVIETDEAAVEPEGEAGGEPLDEEAMREELRRAVEASRAEISSSKAVEADRPSPLDFNAKKAASKEPEIHMPIVVIDDPDGRVELVKVYRTLARLGCGADANLINYTPHGVTISLDPRVMPADDDWGQAVEAVFDRPCELMRDSSHLRVRIASNAKAV
jgi:hypothetical protein